MERLLKIVVGSLIAVLVVVAAGFLWMCWVRYQRIGYPIASKSFFDVRGSTAVYKDRVGSLFNGWGYFVDRKKDNQKWMYIAWFDRFEPADGNDIYMILDDDQGKQFVKLRVRVNDGIDGSDFRVDNLSQITFKDLDKLGLVATYGKDKFVRDFNKGDVVASTLLWDDGPVYDNHGNFSAGQIVIRRFNGKKDL